MRHNFMLYLNAPMVGLLVCLPPRPAGNAGLRCEELRGFTNRLTNISGPLFFGGNCHLDMLVASNLIRVVARLLQRRCVRWADRSTGGSPVATLHKWFSLHGFSAARPWTWISDHVSFKVDLQRMPIKNAQHAARQGWRWHLWQKFLNCGRHECDEVRPLSLQQFVDIDFKKVRQSAIDHTFRAVSTGAMLSPAAM